MKSSNNIIIQIRTRIKTSINISKKLNRNPFKIHKRNPVKNIILLVDWIKKK